MNTTENFLAAIVRAHGAAVNEAVVRDYAKDLPERLWKDAQGDDLPPVDREVIVLVQHSHTYPESVKVAFGHRPDPKGWDGRSITTGKVEHYDVQTYDRGGWNQPNVKYWLDLDIPEILK